MKSIRHIFFGIIHTATPTDKLKSLLENLQRSKKLQHSSSFYEVTLQIADPEVSSLKEELLKSKIKFSERLENSYNVSELLLCKLLLFTINLSPKGESGIRFGTKYDLSSACKKCGTGAKQIGPLYVNRSEIPKNKDLINTLDNDVLVSSRIKDEFVKRNILGLEFRDVITYKTKQQIEYFQILPNDHLSPLSIKTTGIIRSGGCEICNRDGFFSTVKEVRILQYENFDDTKLQYADIFNTWEHFGYSNLVDDPPNPPGVIKPRKVVSYAKPHLVIKPSIMTILNDLKVKGTRFEPVIINGYPDISEWE